MKNWTRKKKLTVWLLVLAVSIGLLCISSNYPSPTAEIAFRRAEKENLVGPAEILEILDFADSRYDHLLVAQSDYGYTFYEWQDSDKDYSHARLAYQPKSERVTLSCTLQGYESLYTGREWLPIFAFADHPAAVSARLTLETAQEDGEAVYELEAQRNDYGYFLFRLKTDTLGTEDFWLIQQLITGAYSNYVLDGTATATVRLYDRTGNLIETKEFTR